MFFNEMIFIEDLKEKDDAGDVQLLLSVIQPLPGDSTLDLYTFYYLRYFLLLF